MGFLNPNAPCGLPPGTLRGLAFILAIGTLCILAGFGKIAGEAFLGVVLIMVKSYFDSRNGGNGHGNGESPPQNQVQPADGS